MEELWHQKGISEAYRRAEATTGRPGSSLLSQAGIHSASTSTSISSSTEAEDQKPLRIFDNACGTGIITYLLCEELGMGSRKDVEILAGDNSVDMVNHTKTRIKENDWKNVTAEVIDSQDTKLPSNYFEHVITNFGIFLMPNPAQALSECVRISKPNAKVSFTCWQTLGWCQIVTDTLARIPNSPSFGDIREILWGRTGAWHDLSIVKKEAEAAGLIDVRVVTHAFYTMQVNPGEFVAEMSLFIDRMKWLLPLGKEDKLRDPLYKEMRELLESRYGKQQFGVPFVAILCTGRKPEDF